MRNLKSYTHIPPQTQNSYRKNQRPIIQNVHLKDLKRKQHNHSQKMCQQTNIQTQQHMGQYGVMKYAFQIYDAFPITDRNSKIVNFEPSCAWFCNLQKAPVNSSRYIVFDKLKYVIRDQITQQPANSLYISIDGLMGYYSSDGTITDRVVGLDLTQIQTTVNQQQLKTYDLLYESKQIMKWKIPDDTTNLKMRIKRQGSDKAIQLPLDCPMTIRFTIQQQKNKQS